MRTPKTLLLAAVLCITMGCSPRDFLTRRLAADLISTSDTFKAPQLFWLRTGIVSNQDFSSPDFMVLLHRGWIIGTEHKCPAGVEPPPCWDVLLTPLGVDTIRPLITRALPDNGHDNGLWPDCNQARSIRLIFTAELAQNQDKDRDQDWDIMVSGCRRQRGFSC